MKGNVAGMPRRYTSYQQSALSNQLFPYSTASPNEPNKLYEPNKLNELRITNYDPLATAH
ncbi:hypothetical protein KAX14_04215 [Candidatus Bipolaricaulota bacterium]|nr:hypothetical protein [Candidatus Bipolaricaulota bacterium]